MRNLKLVIALFILLFSGIQPCDAQETSAKQTQDSIRVELQFQDVKRQIKEIQSDLKINKDAVEEVRRDELNYK